MYSSEFQTFKTKRKKQVKCAETTKFLQYIHRSTLQKVNLQTTYPHVLCLVFSAPEEALSTGARRALPQGATGTTARPTPRMPALGRPGAPGPSAP